MTATLGDAPDWQGYSQWRAGQGTVIDETISLGNPYKSKVVVTNWASFNLYAVLNSGTGFTIVVTWFNDAAYSEVVDTQSWVLAVSSVLNVTMPCLTPYAQIEFTTGESGNQVITAYFTPQNLAVTKATYLTENNTVSEGNLVVPAGGSKTLKLPYVTVGPARLTLVPQDTSGSLRVVAYYSTESGATGGYLWAGYAPTTYEDGITGEFFTPPYPVAVYIGNTDATATHECWCYCQGLSQ